MIIHSINAWFPSGARYLDKLPEHNRISVDLLVSVPVDTTQVGQMHLLRVAVEMNGAEVWNTERVVSVKENSGVRPPVRFTILLSLNFLDVVLRKCPRLYSIRDRNVTIQRKRLT